MAFKDNKIFQIGLLPMYLTCFQIGFIVLMGLFGDYNLKESNKEIPGLYAMFIDVHTMMFIGFGFLMTFLKKYGYSSVGYNFILGAYVLEWALLVRGWIDQGDLGTIQFKLKLEDLLVADFCAAAVLISFGAVLGKTTITQLIAMATFEVLFQSLNEYIGTKKLQAVDVGESIYVHAFGAYFGLAVAKILHHKTVESQNENSIYHSDLFSMIGTIFLWVYWPSFNSAVAVDEGGIRAVINTYISISASCITTFIVSSLVGKGKLNMVHIQNATLAGGVAIGAIADMAIGPFAAAIVGSLIGVLSTLGFQYVTGFFNKILKLHDTCGVNNLHGMPGVVSGFASIIVALVATNAKYGGAENLLKFYPARQTRTALEQSSYQLAALVVTLVFSLVSGALVGFFLRLPIFEQIRDDIDMFTDKNTWENLPDDFDNEKKMKEDDNLESSFQYTTGTVVNTNGVNPNFTINDMEIDI